jgi:hypothetical protein
MYEISDITLDTIVYEIRKRENNLDEILAYQINPKKNLYLILFKQIERYQNHWKFIERLEINIILWHL